MGEPSAVTVHFPLSARKSHSFQMTALRLCCLGIPPLVVTCVLPLSQKQRACEWLLLQKKSCTCL